MACQGSSSDIRHGIPLLFTQYMDGAGEGVGIKKAGILLNPMPQVR